MVTGDGGQIAEVEGNTVKEEDVKFMPIYTGVEGEEKQVFV